MALAQHGISDNSLASQTLRVTVEINHAAIDYCTAMHFCLSLVRTMLSLTTPCLLCCPLLSEHRLLCSSRSSGEARPGGSWPQVS